MNEQRLFRTRSDTYFGELTRKIDLSQTITIFANVGVIAGIVLLAVELRQNNELMEAESRATRTLLNTEIWTSVLEQPHIAPLLLKDRRGEELSDEDELRINALWVRGLFNGQYQFEEDPERFAITSTETWRRAFAAYGSLRRTWLGNTPGSALAGKHQFTPTFVEFMDDVVIRDQIE